MPIKISNFSTQFKALFSQISMSNRSLAGWISMPPVELSQIYIYIFYICIFMYVYIRSINIERCVCIHTNTYLYCCWNFYLSLDLFISCLSDALRRFQTWSWFAYNILSPTHQFSKTLLFWNVDVTFQESPDNNNKERPTHKSERKLWEFKVLHRVYIIYT